MKRIEHNIYKGRNCFIAKIRGIQEEFKFIEYGSKKYALQAARDFIESRSLSDDEMLVLNILKFDDMKRNPGRSGFSGIREDTSKSFGIRYLRLKAHLYKQFIAARNIGSLDKYSAEELRNTVKYKTKAKELNNILLKRRQEIKQKIKSSAIKKALKTEPESITLKDGIRKSFTQLRGFHTL